MDALKPISHYKRKKKINLSTAIIMLLSAVMVSLIVILCMNIYFQNKYDNKLNNFIKGEFSMYQKHYKNLPFDVFVQTKKSAYKEKIPVQEVLAFFHNESNFNRNAISHAGACGIGQLMPAIQAKYNVTDPFNINQNIPAAVKFYRYCKIRANGNIALAYKKYNGGPNKEKFAPRGESEIYSARCMKDLRKTTRIIMIAMTGKSAESDI